MDFCQINSRISKGEEIPNEEILFRFYNPKAFPSDQNEIPISIFLELDLSCDWKYHR